MIGQTHGLCLLVARKPKRPGSAQGPAAVSASAFHQAAFTDTLADLSVDTFGLEQQEAFKTLHEGAYVAGCDRASAALLASCRA
ncbi:hypothetical protein WJX74_000462 [Apatococcus lobatus]|uniref:Uncharacterized protein n=1 Tax=Apatococcus lobatus TaxID=904363 RepID=A0AAW1Q9N0_9CHLO